ncbi:MAG: hypothetical protein HOI45_14745, partial [Rhodospirillaceae bacterium]|nr:hypothetical protein [Rhodospirillaceae bacterium]
MTSTNTIEPDTAFAIYFAMGIDRSLAKLPGAIQAELGHTVSIKTLERWSSHHGWQRRIQEIERERTDRQVANYLEEAPTVTAKAMQALESTIDLSNRLVTQATLLNELKIKNIDDLGKVSKLLTDATKLVEVLQGRPTERVEQVSPARQETGERAALAAALEKLAKRESSENGPPAARHIDFDDNPSTAPVIDGNYIEVNRKVSDPGVRM